MAEGDGLRYRIEFEADEESLIDAIGDAIISAKPAIYTMMRIQIEDAFNQIIEEITGEMKPIRLDVEVIELKRDIDETRDRTAPLPHYSELSVGEMIQKTVDVLEERGEDLEPMLSSAINAMLSQILEFMSGISTEQANMLARAPVEQAMMQNFSYGDMAASLGATIGLLNSTIARISERGRTDIPEGFEENLSDIISWKKGIEAVRAEIPGGERMDVGDLLRKMGIKPDYSDPEFGHIIRSEIVAAIGESGITIGMFEPVVGKEQQDKFDEIANYLRDVLEDRFSGVVERVKSVLGMGDRKELEVRRFGGFVEEPRWDVEQLRNILQKPTLYTDELTKASTSGDIPDLDRLVESLNNLIRILERRGEPEAARVIRTGMEGMLAKQKGFAESGDLGQPDR